MAVRRAPGLWRTLSGRWRRRVATRSSGTGRGGGIDLSPILEFVLAIDDHNITGIQTCAQANAVAGCLRDGHDANLRGVVGTGGIDVSSLGTALNGSGGNVGELLLVVNEKVDVDELIWGKSLLVLCKNCIYPVSTPCQNNLIFSGLQFSPAH